MGRGALRRGKKRLPRWSGKRERGKGRGWRMRSAICCSRWSISPASSRSIRVPRSNRQTPSSRGGSRRSSASPSSAESSSAAWGWRTWTGCGTRRRRADLWPQLVEGAGECDRLADVRDTADPRDRALQPESEARVHEGAVLAEVEVPAVRLLGELLLADALL